MYKAMVTKPSSAYLDSQTDDFFEWIASNWKAAKAAQPDAQRTSDPSGATVPIPLHKWLELRLIPAIRQNLGAKAESAGDIEIAILGLLAAWSPMRAGPPPAALCAHMRRLVEEAHAIAVVGDQHLPPDEVEPQIQDSAPNSGDSPSRRSDIPLSWISWLMAATGSAAWRHPEYPPIEGPWAEEWTGASMELQFMAEETMRQVLSFEMMTVVGFGPWIDRQQGAARRSAVISKLASDCALDIVTGITGRVPAKGVAPDCDTGKKTNPDGSRKSNKDYRYLRSWDPREATLPKWVSILTCGYPRNTRRKSSLNESGDGASANAPTSSEGSTSPEKLPGLPNDFKRGWAFPPLASLTPLRNDRTALQLCLEPECVKKHKEEMAPKTRSQKEPWPRTQFFWTESCRGCGARISNIVKEQDRFVLPPDWKRGFFFRCRRCASYTYLRECVEADYPPSEDQKSVIETGVENLPEIAAEMSANALTGRAEWLGAQLEDELSITLEMLGEAARTSLISRGPQEDIVRTLEWFVSKIPKRQIDRLRARQGAKNESDSEIENQLADPDYLGSLILKNMAGAGIDDLNDHDAGVLFLQILLDELAASIYDPPKGPKRKKTQPFVKRPPELVCDACKSAEYLLRSSVLWILTLPPNGVFVGRNQPGTSN